MKIEESEIWKELSKLSLTTRETMIRRFSLDIETTFNCKIKDRAFADLGQIINPVLSVQDSFRNICYLKEFVPVT